MGDPVEGGDAMAGVIVLLIALGVLVAWSLVCGGIGLGIGWMIWGR